MAQQQNSNHENNHSSNTPSRQPASYPSPSQYPSPSMSGYAYPPPTGQNDSSYRASPTGSNVSLPSLNLPPIRTIDGRQQPPQQQTPQQQPQGGPPAMPPALPPPMNHQYYAGHTLPPPQHMNITSDPSQPMRYPLPPPPDGRIMSGGRHKKEIKRRTKTGCLTCRKRRIKCDEAHPACRNCQKSKRECLGYDPIFKAQPGPTNIQPAPIPVPNMQGNPAAGPPYPPPPPPQGYMAAGTQPYAPPLSASANSPRSSTEPYNNDYGAAIDPALEGTGIIQGPRGKRTKMDELCAIQGIPPPPPSYKSPLSNHQIEDIKNAYLNVYAPAVDKFFETRWFRIRGLNHLLNDPHLCELFATLLLRLNIEPTHHAYYNEKIATQSLEVTIIWAIMGLARLVANNPNPTNGQVNYLEIDDGVQEAAKRFEIFETLILGQHLDAKLEGEPKVERNGNAVPDQLQIREKEFWRHVHTFLALHDDEASAAKEIDDTLASCRALLDSRENRDVIYSIIIARHIGQRLAEFPNNLQQPTTNDETDNKNKLHVAKSFLETQQMRGTTQVVQRVCNMVVRSWALPR